MSEKVVVKIGSNVLTPEGRLNTEVISRIAREICTLMKGGNRFLVITSGAVKTGKSAAGNLALPEDKIAQKQLLASIGQPKLIAHYASALESNGGICGQILLTRRDFTDQDRRFTLLQNIDIMLEYGIVPILNENDVLTSEELQNDFTDNDQLAALVVALIKADRLIVLSDVDGFLRDPSNPSSEVISVIEHVNDYIHLIDPAAGNGKGGMRSKLETAETVTSLGTVMHIAKGTRTNVLTDIMEGRQTGTFFPAKT